MQRSNIMGGSNIYPCGIEPFKDKKFLEQIHDFEKLSMLTKVNLGYTLGFTSKQKEILQTDMRCIYAKSDPCWGYIDGQGIQSKCINGECSQIRKCNSNYRDSDKSFWRISKDDEEAYGDPKKLHRYYLVDLITVEEKVLYSSDAIETGVVFPSIKDEILKEKAGQRKVIIGYEVTKFSDYCDESITPIWGYVEEEKKKLVLKRNLYGSQIKYIRVEDKTDEVTKVEAVEILLPNEKLSKKEELLKVESTKWRDLQKSFKGKIMAEYKLMDISEKIIDKLYDSKNQTIVLVFSNPAELQYVSSMLIKSDIDHSLYEDHSSSFMLMDIRSMIFISNAKYIISSSIIKEGCSDVTSNGWEILDKETEITQLSMGAKEFYCIDLNTDRWGCRGIYGTTHINVKLEDLIINEELPSGKNRIIFNINESKGYYSIVCSKTKHIIGRASDSFKIQLLHLMEKGEISNMPVRIQDIVVEKKNNKLILYGIGYLKFDEY